MTWKHTLEFLVAFGHFQKDRWMVLGILRYPGGGFKLVLLTGSQAFAKRELFPAYIPKGEKEGMPKIFANLRSITHHYDHRFTPGTIF